MQHGHRTFERGMFDGQGEGRQGSPKSQHVYVFEAIASIILLYCAFATTNLYVQVWI